MAVTGHVWGIDIGQCGLKALRGRLGDGGSVVVDGYDYIEYPKILSQQDAEPDELIRDALKTFLSRNSVRGDKVAMSVSGQSGLARFIKLPPVDDKQLPSLVGYEAKQQIPFALEDVVWDYQKLPTIGEEDEDDMPQTEVGLFAMKRDQVLRMIRPFVDLEVEVDIVQLLPIATYNAIVHDRKLSPDKMEGEADPDTWHAIFSMGTDQSDLVLTNGARIWQRTIPIGGSQFTKQLTTELKLTFAKAELTKRNVREAPDAKRVFQAMRPVFSDLATELQRSLGYFGGIEKRATVKKMFAVGNSLKLPGLTQYLEKSLDLPIVRVDRFEQLTGDTVLSDAQFKDNSLAFAPSYGLMLQGLGQSSLRTSLIPREIVAQRMVRRKKPWVAAVAASILAALAVNFFFHWQAWNSVHEEDWKSAKAAVEQLSNTSSQYKSEDTELETELRRLDVLGDAIVGNADGRLLWLELLKAISVSLPVDESLAQGVPSLKERPLLERKEIFIDEIETEYFAQLSEWYDEKVQQKYSELQAERQAQQQAQAQGDPAADGEQPPSEEVPADAAPADATAMGSEGESAAPEGGGWVIQISGHHFQHNNSRATAAEYLRVALLDQLEFGSVELPIDGERIEIFKVKELGILYPVLVYENLNLTFEIFNPEFRPPTNATMGMQESRGSQGIFQLPSTNKDDKKIPPKLEVPRYEFVVQFFWKQTTLRERLEARKKKADEAKALESAAVPRGSGGLS